mgnify:CR=1 FL=1
MQSSFKIRTLTKKGPGHGGRATACANASVGSRRQIPPYKAKPFGKGNLIKLPIPLNPDATPFIPQRFV